MNKFVFCFLAAVATHLSAQPTPSTVLAQHQAPPTPPPIITNATPGGPRPTLEAVPVLYSIGNPTDEEQLYLEYVNRARANPTAEGIRLRDTTDPDVLSAYASFSVDTSLMASQIATNPVAPPLSINPNLTIAARQHSQDMLVNDYQGHTGSDGSTLGTRASTNGYSNFSNLGENVFSYSKTVFYGHAGFEVDWGGSPATGGMQSPPGHRLNIHSLNFREIGVGVVDGSNTNVGPQLVTQDFGAQLSPVPFITGVAYYDFNTNSFYDLGEGIGGIIVTVTNSNYYAVTTNSGAYSVPVAGNGTYTITFAGANLVATQRTVTVSNSGNIKVDFIPTYSPPTLAGLDTGGINQTNIYAFTPVGAAISYQWKQSRLAPFTATEGAESGLTTNVTATVSSGYTVVVTDAHASGAASFHLAQPDFTAQYLALNRNLRANTNSQLIFASRLGYATANQIARAQVSSDSGATWQDVFTRVGTGDQGQTSFVRVTNSLSAYAGKEIRIRFVYDFVGGSAFTQTASNFGWCIDDIQFANADELVGTVITQTASTNFNFVPTTNGVYMLQVSAKLFGRDLSYGPAKLVTVYPSARITRTQIVANQLQIDFLVAGSASAYQLESTTNLAATFGNEGVAPVAQGGGIYRFTVTFSSSGQKFYRVRVLP